MGKIEYFRLGQHFYLHTKIGQMARGEEDEVGSRRDGLEDGDGKVIKGLRRPSCDYYYYR